MKANKKRWRWTLKQNLVDGEKRFAPEVVRSMVAWWGHVRDGATLQTPPLISERTQAETYQVREERIGDSFP